MYDFSEFLLALKPYDLFLGAAHEPLSTKAIKHHRLLNGPVNGAPGPVREKGPTPVTSSYNSSRALPARGFCWASNSAELALLFLHTPIHTWSTSVTPKQQEMVGIILFYPSIPLSLTP